MNKEVLSILKFRLYKGFWFGWGGFFVLLFIVGVFLQNLSISTAIVSSLFGSLIGILLYILLMRNVIYRLVRKFEGDFEKNKFSETRFEDYAEVGTSYFNMKSGKFFLINDLLIFKPLNTRSEKREEFIEFPLNEIRIIFTKKDFFGRFNVKLKFKNKNYNILFLRNPQKFLDILEK